VKRYLSRLIFIFGFIGLTNCSEVAHDKATNSIDYTQVFEEYKTKSAPLADIEFGQRMHSDPFIKDMMVLEYVLKEANTSLYRYRSMQEIEEHFKNAISDLGDSTYYLEFVRKIAHTFNFIACGHSGWGHTDAYKSYRNQQMKFFPLNIYAIDDQYFIRQNLSLDTSLKHYDEILSINGMKIGEINNILKEHMNKDGTSGDNGRSEIEKYFQMAYSNFIDNPKIFQLEIKDDKGSIGSINLEALSLPIIDSIGKIRYSTQAKNDLPLSLKIDTKTQIATYTIKSFRNEVISHFQQDFELFTDSVFKEINIHQIEDLIIDIRDNTGGWTANGRYLFSYFIKNEMSYVDRVEFKKIEDFTFKPLITQDAGILDSMQFETSASAMLEWINYPSLRVEPNKENNYGGKLIILINDLSHSCSVLFSSMMSNHTDAIFVGEESGGAQCGQNGMVLNFVLPFSGVPIHISTAQYYLNISDPNNSKGVEVDYAVQNNIESNIKGKDSVLNFALNLIQNIDGEN